MTTGDIIDATDLVAGYVPEVNILNGCNLTVGPGEFVGMAVFGTQVDIGHEHRATARRERCRLGRHPAVSVAVAAAMTGTPR